MDQLDALIEHRLPLAEKSDTDDEKEDENEAEPFSRTNHPLGDERSSLASTGIGMAWLKSIVKENYTSDHLSPDGKKILDDLMQLTNTNDSGGMPSSSYSSLELDENGHDTSLWDALEQNQHQQSGTRLFPTILNIVSIVMEQKGLDHPIVAVDLVKTIFAEVQKDSSILPSAYIPSVLDSMHAIYGALIFLSAPITTLSHDRVRGGSRSVTDPLDIFPSMPILQKTLPKENSTYPTSFSAFMHSGAGTSLTREWGDPSYQSKLKRLESFFWSNTSIPEYTPRLRNIPRGEGKDVEESYLKQGQFQMPKKITRKRKKVDNNNEKTVATKKTPKEELD